MFDSLACKPLIGVLGCFATAERQRPTWVIWLANAVMLLVQALGSMLIYPNSMSFPIMDNSGIPPPPQGMLIIRVLRATKLGSPGISKIDPFVEVSCLLSTQAATYPLYSILCLSGLR